MDKLLSSGRKVGTKVEKAYHRVDRGASWELRLDILEEICLCLVSKVLASSMQRQLTKSLNVFQKVFGILGYQQCSSEAELIIFSHQENGEKLGGVDREGTNQLSCRKAGPKRGCQRALQSLPSQFSPFWYGRMHELQSVVVSRRQAMVVEGSQTFLFCLQVSDGTISRD